MQSMSLVMYTTEGCQPCEDFKAHYAVNSEFSRVLQSAFPVILDPVPVFGRGATARSQWWARFHGVDRFPAFVVFGPDKRAVRKVYGFNRNNPDELLLLQLGIVVPDRVPASSTSSHGGFLTPRDVGPEAQTGRLRQYSTRSEATAERWRTGSASSRGSSAGPGTTRRRTVRCGRSSTNCGRSCGRSRIRRKMWQASCPGSASCRVFRPRYQGKRAGGSVSFGRRWPPSWNSGRRTRRPKLPSVSEVSAVRLAWRSPPPGGCTSDEKKKNTQR